MVSGNFGFSECYTAALNYNSQTRKFYCKAIYYSDCDLLGFCLSKQVLFSLLLKFFDLPLLYFHLQGPQLDIATGPGHHDDMTCKNTTKRLIVLIFTFFVITVYSHTLHSTMPHIVFIRVEKPTCREKRAGLIRQITRYLHNHSDTAPAILSSFES